MKKKSKKRKQVLCNWTFLVTKVVWLPNLNVKNRKRQRQERENLYLFRTSDMQT